jgi:hypothetical protein
MGPNGKPQDPKKYGILSMVEKIMKLGIDYLLDLESHKSN